jgi:phenylacetate-coenzyme A ligase PaaK-like adenylate-forming protein
VRGVNVFPTQIEEALLAVVVAPGSIERSVGKAKRVIDKRAKN